MNRRKIRDVRSQMGGMKLKPSCVFTPVSPSRTGRTGLKVTRRRERLERPDSVVMTGNAFDCFATNTGMSTKEGN